MGRDRQLGLGALGLVLLLGGPQQLAAAAPESLIVTQLPDPDPNYVPPREPRTGAWETAVDDDNPTFDQAMQNLGRAIGQAAMVQQQAIQAKCRAAIPAGIPASQRFAWEASCRYERH